MEELNPNYRKLVDSFIEKLNDEYPNCRFWSGCGHTPFKSTIKGVKTFQRITEKGYYNNPYGPHIKNPVTRFANLIGIDILIYNGDPQLFHQYLLHNKEVQSKKQEFEEYGIIYVAHYDLKKIIQMVDTACPFERELTSEEQADRKLYNPSKIK